jgi:hypothetical protein
MGCVHMHLGMGSPSHVRSVVEKTGETNQKV